MSFEMKLSEDSKENDAAKTELSETESPKGCCLLDLSDYALLHVFSFLNATDLYQLSRTCKRLEELVKEKRLWHRVDARDKPITKDKVEFCIKNLNERTRQLYFAANNRAEQISTFHFLSESSVTKNLRILAIENQLIRGDLLTLAEYPVTLVELSLRKSFVVNFAHFFRHSDHAMRNLKVLILDQCGWVETNMMVSFSKYPKLEILSLYMCKKLSDNDISYLSLAGCFGFKKLRVLDARFTGLGDQILKTFYKHKTLTDIYFQSYVGTYTLEKSQRELELVIGSAPKKHHYLSPYDDILDTQLEPMRMCFGSHTYKTYRMQTLSDEGVIMYKFVEPDLTQDYKIDSVLYEPPYSQCQCGFYECDRTAVPVVKCNNNRPVKTEKSKIATLEQIIAFEKHVKYVSHMFMLKPKLHLDPRRAQVNAEDYEAEATPENKSLKWLNLREPRNEYEISMLEHTDLYALTPELRSNNIVINFLRLGNEDNVESGDESSDNEEIFANPGLYNERMEVRQKIFGNESDEEMNGQRQGSGDESSDNEETFANPALYNNEQMQQKLFDTKTNEEMNGQKEDEGDSSSEIDEDTKGKSQYILGSSGPEANESISEDVSKLAEAKSDDTIVEDSRTSSCDSFSNAIFDHEAIAESTSKTDDFQSYNGGPPENTTSKAKRKNDSSANGMNKKMKRLDDSEEAQPGPSGLNSRQSSNSEVSGNDPGPSGDFENLDNEEVDVPEVWNAPQPDPRSVIRILIGEGEMKTTAVRRLSLRGYGKVTDTSLYYLSKLKLELLDVTQTSVTKRGVCDFMVRNPECRVIHESACVCRPRLHF